MVRFHIVPIAAMLILAVPFDCIEADSNNAYRWVDKNGQVFYSDKVPPQHSKLRRSELNNRGVTVGITEREKTRAEVVREQELAKLRAAQQRLLNEHKAKDLSLLRTFRSEKEINDTLKSKLTTIEILSTVTMTNLSRLQKRLEDEEGKAAERERNGTAVPDWLLKKIAGLRRQIDTNHKKLNKIEGQKLAMKNKFANDLERFRDLSSRRHGNTGQIASDKNTVAANSEDGSSIILSVAICKNQTSCDQAWRLSNRYIQKHATTPIRINTDRIIYTAAPSTENDIALSISKITQKNSEKVQLFLDVRCQQSGKGQDLCTSNKVRDILSSFRPFIKTALNN